MVIAGGEEVIVLSGLAPSPLQVPPVSGWLPPLIHDLSLDLLCGHDRKRCRRRERGEAQGDREDHGPEGFHLLVELGSVQCAPAGCQRCPP